MKKQKLFIIHHHQTSIIRNVKGTSLRRKKNKKKDVNMTHKVAITTYISIITLNVNGLNAPFNQMTIDK